MLRLVQADLSPAWQLDFGDRTPALVVDIRTRHAFLLQRGHLRLEIVTHEIEFMPVILLGGMERRFPRRQSKNQPSVARIHRLESENISKEGAIRLRVLAVHDDMRTVDHEPSPFPAH